MSSVISEIADMKRELVLIEDHCFRGSFMAGMTSRQKKAVRDRVNYDLNPMKNAVELLRSAMFEEDEEKAARARSLWIRSRNSLGNFVQDVRQHIAYFGW